jgi:adenylate cyclase
MMEMPQKAEPPAAIESQATILVVDDSPLSAQLVQTQLERAGYKVVLAYDGYEALAQVAKAPPDLIILDVMMPGLDGFDVCKKLRAEREMWYIPIILLTALNQPRDRVQGIEAGADDFLSKPFHRQELLARVRSLLNLKTTRDDLQVERNRLALLYNTSQGINSQLALDEVLGRIVTETREALAANMCSIIIVDSDQQISRQFIDRSGSPPAVAAAVSPAIFREGLAGWILARREATIVHDVSQDDRWLILPRDTAPVGSVAGTPLLVGSKSMGVLLVTHPEPGFFDQNHLALLSSIGAQAAVAVRNAELYEQEQRRRHELELLQQAGAEISAELNWKALTHLIIDQATSLLSVSGASLMLLDETERFLAIEACRGLPTGYARQERLEADRLAPLLSDGKRSFQIPDLSKQPLGHSALLVKEGNTRQLSLALVTSGRLMGLLNLYRQGQGREFSTGETQLAETFAQQAAIALDNTRLLENTREEQAKLSAVLTSTADAVLVVDLEGKLLLANPAAEQSLGLDARISLGRSLKGKVPSGLLRIFDQVTATGQSISAEVQADPGKSLYISVSPVAGLGQVAVVQDISPLKELEAMRLKTEKEQRRRLRDVFERYVGPELVDQILAQEAGLLETSQRRDVVVLFADLRRSSKLTSVLPAPLVIEVLNEFFTDMVSTAHRYQGTVFDLVGDELMVGFGAPLAQEDAGWRALQTAGDMQQAFAGLQSKWQGDHGLNVGLGIGLDRGLVALGSIGAPSHMSFGMVGDAVNTAHRLVELARHGEIIVSKAVVDSLPRGSLDWTFQPLPPDRLKHKGKMSQVFRAQRQPS